MASSVFMSGKGLTPPKTFNTDLPFLRPQKIKATNEDGVTVENLKLVEDEKQKIVLQSISEFCDHHVKGSFFDTDSQVVLLHDRNGQPMIFTIGTNKVTISRYLALRKYADISCKSVSTSCLWSMGAVRPGRLLTSHRRTIIMSKFSMPHL